MSTDLESSQDARDRLLARLWFCSLGSLLISTGPAVLVSVATTAPATPPPAISSRAFDVLLAQQQAQSISMDRLMLWFSALVGTTMYVAACVFAVLCVRKHDRRRTHGMVAGALLLMLAIYATGCVGKSTHLMHGVFE